jgi:hypothetical protein
MDIADITIYIIICYVGTYTIIYYAIELETLGYDNHTVPTYSNIL